MNARMNVDITLGTVAGAGILLSKVEGLEEFYFEALTEVASTALEKWPLTPFKNEKAVRKYKERLHAQLEASEARVKEYINDVPSMLNFLLALVVDLQESLKGGKRTALLDPVIELLTEYIDRLELYEQEAIDRGLKANELYKY